MEYRGFTFAVVQTIPTGWRWSVPRGQRTEKVGKSFSRDTAIFRAKRFIDELIKNYPAPEE